MPLAINAQMTREEAAIHYAKAKIEEIAMRCDKWHGEKTVDDCVGTLTMIQGNCQQALMILFESREERK